jgi:hypothetical protein
MLKTIADLRAALALDESRFKHLTTAHRKALREVQRSVSTAEKERNINILRRLTKPQTNAEADRLADERLRETLLRQGRTEAKVDELLSKKGA